MVIEMIVDSIQLLLVGLLGYALFKILHVPAAPFLGTIFTIGILRACHVDLPTSPYTLTFVVQMMLGLYAGSRVNQETVKKLKEIAIPAVIIILWSLGVSFTLGVVLNFFTELDLFTSILAGSIGGLPEMTVLALAMDVDVTVVIVMQVFRLVITAISFPIILTIWLKIIKFDIVTKETTGNINPKIPKLRFASKLADLKPLLNNGYNIFKNKANKHILYVDRNDCLSKITSGLFTIIIALLGSIIFLLLEIPAGVMVGSMFTIITASLLKVKLLIPSQSLFILIIIGAGVIVSDNISPETIQVIFSGELLIPIVIATVFVFTSSLITAFSLRAVTKWDLPTCYLAAAPGGFSIVVALAISYDKEPTYIFLLHLCRLIALKTVIPFVFRIFFV